MNKKLSLHLFGCTFIQITKQQISEDLLFEYTHIIFKSENKYCFRNIQDDYFLDDIEDENPILFSITMTSPLIQYEIENISQDDFLQEINFAGIFEKEKDNLMIHEYRKNVSHHTEQYFVIEYIDLSGDTAYGYEYDYTINYYGYLEKGTLEIKRRENNEN